jgi:hypothetical protein
VSSGHGHVAGVVPGGVYPMGKHKSICRDKRWKHLTQYTPLLAKFKYDNCGVFREFCGWVEFSNGNGGDGSGACPQVTPTIGVIEVQANGTFYYSGTPVTFPTIVFPPHSQFGWEHGGPTVPVPPECHCHHPD